MPRPRAAETGHEPSAYFLRWSKTLLTPVFTDGFDALVFGFSFFGLRISRFDFCCFDMGMVTSLASQPAMRIAPVGRRAECAIRQGQRRLALRILV